MIGVGLRVKVNYFNTENNVELTNLSAASGKLNASKMSATFTASVFGLESSDITASFPIVSEVNPTSIQQIVAAMATIKSKIYDENTQVFPQLIAVKADSICVNVKDGYINSPIALYTVRSVEEFDDIYSVFEKNQNKENTVDDNN